MTSTADQNFPVKSALGIVHMLDGGRLMMRLAMRVGAVTFALVVALIWIAPGATWDTDVLLFKLALSVMSGFVAAGMWQRSLPPVQPTVEVDIANMEVRVMRSDGGAQPRLIESCNFCDLEAVDLQGRHIILWAKGKRLLADITLSNATAHASLLAALRHEGKLA